MEFLLDDNSEENEKNKRFFEELFKKNQRKIINREKSLEKEEEVNQNARQVNAK